MLQKLKKKGDKMKKEFRESGEPPIKKILKLIRNCQVWFRNVGFQLESLKLLLITSANSLILDPKRARCIC